MQHNGATASKKAWQTHNMMRENAKAKSLFKNTVSLESRWVQALKSGTPHPQRWPWCRVTPYTVMAPLCLCSAEEPAVTLLAFLVFPAGSFPSGLVGKALLCIFTDLSSSPSMKPENWVKLSKLRAFRGIPAPYHNPFAVLKGWNLLLPFEATANSARESCRNSSRYTISKGDSVNLISF